MESYLLSRWEAIDLFIKIISKLENKDGREIENDLLMFLIKYKGAKLSSQIAEEYLRPFAEKNASSHYYPTFLSDLSVAIRTGVAKILSENRLILMLQYIGKGGSIKQYQPIEKTDKKQESLEQSSWWMYSYEHYTNKSDNTKKLLLTREFIEFKSFGYTTLTACKTHEGSLVSEQYYSGQYYIRNKKYLIINLRNNDTDDKEIHMIIDIGSGHINIGDTFIGYYLNAGTNLYFGPLLFEKIPYQDKSHTAIFKDYEPQLDENIWKFFRGLELFPYKIVYNFGGKGGMNRFLDM